MVFVLKSVGTAFNTSTGMLYPINNDESFDIENGININKDEVSTEWLEEKVLPSKIFIYYFI